MDVQKLYISTIDPNARFIARKYDLGLEIADFCYAYNMDEGFCQMDALVRKKLEGIRRRLFHGPFSELFPCAIDLKARALAADRFRQAIFLAADYGAKNIVLHGGFLPYGYFPQWYVEQSILFWKGFLADMPEDVSIFLENVLEPEPEMLQDIVEAVGDARLGLCLDIGHANVYGKRQHSLGETGVVSIFSEALMNNKDIYIDGDGEQSRDFIYVKDIARIKTVLRERELTNEK